MQAYCAKRIPADKPEDYHWDWQQKAGWWRPLLGYHSFALLCRNELQGMMLANDFKSARLQALRQTCGLYRVSRDCTLEQT